MMQLLLNTTTPHFQLLPMSKVDQSYLRSHEVPPLQYPKKSYNFVNNLNTLEHLYLVGIFY